MAIRFVLTTLTCLVVLHCLGRECLYSQQVLQPFFRVSTEGVCEAIVENDSLLVLDSSSFRKYGISDGRLKDTSKLEIIRGRNHHGNSRLLGRGGAVAYLPTGDGIVVANFGDDQGITLYGTGRLKGEGSRVDLKNRFPSVFACRDSDSLFAAVVDRDSTCLAIISPRDELLDVELSEPIMGEGSTLQSLKMSDSGPTVLAATIHNSDEDRELVLFDKELRRVGEMSGLDGSFEVLSVVKIVLASGDFSFRVLLARGTAWVMVELREGDKEFRVVRQGEIPSFGDRLAVISAGAFSPSGDLVAVCLAARRSMVYVSSLSEDKLVAQGNVDRGLTSLRFTDDGANLIGCRPFDVSLWKVPAAARYKQGSQAGGSKN